VGAPVQLCPLRPTRQHALLISLLKCLRVCRCTPQHITQQLCCKQSVPQQQHPGKQQASTGSSTGQGPCHCH
jgi:hypothetical protein